MASKEANATTINMLDTTRGVDIPPLTVGPRRLHYQYSAALPQSHLTFVSIIEGIAFGVLLLSVPVPNAAELMNPVGFLISEYLYLPYIVSGLLIVLIWQQFAQASLFILWPLSITQLTLVLLAGVAQIVTFREIAHFNGWLVGFGCIGLVGGCLRLNNLRLRTTTEYEAKWIKADDDNTERSSGMLYWALGGILVLTGITFHYHPYWLGTPTLREWVVLLLLFALLIVVEELNRAQVRDILGKILLDSDLRQIGGGGLMYRDPVTELTLLTKEGRLCLLTDSLPHDDDSQDP